MSQNTDNEYKKLKLICDINKQFQNTLNLKVLMHQILEKIIDELHAEAGSFFMAYPSYKVIVCTAAIGPARDKVLNIRIPYSTGVVGWCIDNKKPSTIFDTSKDERFKSNVDDKTGFVTKSILCVPIIYNNIALGAVELFNKKSDDGLFNENDLEIMSVIADNAATALNNARLHDIEKRAKQKSLIINQFAQLVNSSLELDVLLDNILNKIVENLDCEAGSIWLLEEDSKKIVCKIALGPTKNKVIGLKLSYGTGIVGSVIKNKKMDIVLNAEKDKRFISKIDKHTGFKTKSMLCVPLMDGDKSIGCIQVMNRKIGNKQFNHDDVELMKSFTVIAAISIKNATMFEKEKKIHELSALLKLGKEISSSLDLDYVATSVVNLTKDIVNFDRAILLLESKPGHYEISAVTDIAGDYKDDESLKLLLKTAELFLENKEENYFPDVQEYLKKTAGVQQFKEYFKKATINSFYCKLLHDNEGNLGILFFESQSKDFLTSDKRDILEILFTQIIVALRNASLYHSVPKFDLFGSKGKKKKWLKWYHKIGIAVIILVLSSFIKITYKVNVDAKIIPLKKRNIYSKVSGIIKNINIKTGDVIKKGRVIAIIEDKEFKHILLRKKDNMAVIQNEIRKYKALNSLIKLAEKQNELKLIINEIDNLKDKINSCKIIAPVSGQIFVENAESKSGEFISEGSKFGEIVNLSALKVELSIPENKLAYVTDKSKVNMKFTAYPTEIMRSQITYLGVKGKLNKLSNSYYYPAYCELQNPDNKFRIAMTGNGRIHGNKVSLFKYLLEGPINAYYMNFKW